MACVCTCLATLVNTDITCAPGFIINRLILNNMASVKILHEVMPCIYKQGDEKPAMKWSFITKMETRDLTSFLRSLHARFYFCCGTKI